MDGLAYYRLKQIPQKKGIKRKVKEPVIVNTEEGTKYHCARCNRVNLINTSSHIKCIYCDWRILEKRRSERVVIEAV